ncbi:reverse transcriptase domain-containing protein [Tanacetum coccineum]|uniref:Reverse transcriptase domain-containing protein n=1 Tax=Tanacetum coccineum TaxID=301880 RepID=A0ABQ4YUU9_9ASTR
MKAITTRSGVAYEGPSNPTEPFLKKVVERETEEITNEEQNDFQGSTAQIPPPVIPKPIPKPEIPKDLHQPTPIPSFQVAIPLRRMSQCTPRDFMCLEKLLNDDPFQLPLMDLKQSEVTEAKSSIEEPPELELKDLPSHLEYAFLEENDKLPVIIAKDLMEAIVNHRSCQRRVNPKINEVIKKEVIKLLDAGMIYPIFDSPWVSLIHCVPKKGGMAVVANEENELIPTRLVTGWRKLTEATILVVPDWNLPFELKCDASDYAIGAVLGQRKTKHFQPIHYASKTMTEAQIHYTTTEKEMLAVVLPKEYRIILVAVDYLSKWVEAKALPTNDARVTHRLASNYPLMSGQVEVSNRGLKRILERTVGENRASWSDKLDDAFYGILIYKEKTKKLHDSKIKNRIFNIGDQVFTTYLRLKIFSEKLKTRWSGPFTIAQVFPYGIVELSQPDGPNFKVNGHRVKHYFEEGQPPSVVGSFHTLLRKY